MHKFYLFILFAFTYGFDLSAQDYNVLRGVVKHNGKNMEYVNIQIVELQKGTVTNENGSFILEIPKGIYTLSITFLGFKTILDTIELFGGKEMFLQYHMSLSDFVLSEFVVIDEQSGLSNKTPYTISSIKADNIQLKGNPSGLMGFLKEEPGVYGAEMGHGIVKPFIRGLGFSRVVTIYQGNKLENHQWGADHGLGVNDLGVSQVEVIKGPASILYGSGAIGGVVIVKDNEKYLKSTKLSFNAGLTYNSISGGLRPHMSIGKSFNNGFFLAGDVAYENHSDYVSGNKRIIGNSRFNTQTYRIHTGVNKTNFKNKISYSYHYQKLGIIDDNEMEEDESLATTRYDRKMQLPFQQVKDQVISYRQTTMHNKVITSLNISHHINDRNEIEDDLEKIDLGLMQNHTFYNARVSHNINSKINQNIGFQGSFIINKNKNTAKEILIPDARIKENGIYYLVNFDLGKYFIQSGIRYDYRVVIADASAPHLVDYGFELPGNPENRKLKRTFQGFTGSLGVSRKIKELNTLKLNLSSGYRAPDLAELFSNGPHPGTSRFEMGNDAFKREQSFQFDLGWVFNHKKASVSTSIYNTIVQNYVFFTATDEFTLSGLEIWEFKQANALLYGTEISLTYTPFENDKLHLSGSLAIVRGKRMDVNEFLTFVPADNYRFQITSQPFEKVKTNFHSNLRYVANHTRPGFGESNTNGFFLWNVGASHLFEFDKHTLNFGLTVFNILGTNYFDHMSILRAFEIPSTGRNFMLSVQYNF